jgi:hypothetical protein
MEAEPQLQPIENPHKMPRNTAILYLQDGDVPFKGMTKLENGDIYWIEAWVKEVNKKMVLELKLNPKR